MQAFVEVNGDDLSIPELDDYRKHLNEIREKQSNGGKNGARITNQGLAKGSGNPKGNSTGNSTANSQLTRQGTNESLVELSRAKSRKTQSVNSADISTLNEHQAWANDYDKASNGE